jgi:CHAT domain-containing protein
LYQRAAQAIATQQGSSGILWNIVQLAKGRRFAAMIAAGAAQRVDVTKLEPDLQQRIVRLRAEVRAGEPGHTIGDQLGESILVSPYDRGSVRLAGDTARERLANVEHRFDVTLVDELTSLSRGAGGLLADEADVRAALDAETALVQYYAPTAPGEEGMVLIAITTRESTSWAAVRIARENMQGMTMVIDGASVTYSLVSGMVQRVRETVPQDPGDGDVSSEAASAAAAAYDLFLDPVREELAALRREGKTHLCIVPHGAMAYLPMHLLGRDGPLLADEWVVTYLPNLQLLSTHRGGATLRRERASSLIALGRSFAGNEEGYAEIPEAVIEVAAVAASMEGSALLDDDATEAAVREALRSARYVHIATHGAHQRTAPAFQMLRLAPTADSDGDLFAYELLGQDLRGLDLVTLSACETSLGRFDVADNPLGLPATLFACGARTLIGTLWEVDSACSEYFFTTLYGLLRADLSKRAAFKGALDATRKYFPQYRDWGAFQLTGDWT